MTSDIPLAYTNGLLSFPGGLFFPSTGASTEYSCSSGFNQIFAISSWTVCYVLEAICVSKACCDGFSQPFVMIGIQQQCLYFKSKPLISFIFNQCHISLWFNCLSFICIASWRLVLVIIYPRWLFNSSRFTQVILDGLLCRYKAVGIRLDSGDLAYLSCEARKFFIAVEKEFGVPGFGKMGITASNDLNEETLDALNKQVFIL